MTGNTAKMRNGCGKSPYAEILQRLQELREICGACKSCDPKKRKDDGISGGNLHIDSYEDYEIAFKHINPKVAADWTPPGGRSQGPQLVGVPDDVAEVFAFVLADVAMLNDAESLAFVHALNGERAGDAWRGIADRFPDIAEAVRLFNGGVDRT